VIYDTMDYVGKPKDLSADKISPAMLIYERQITRPSTDSERKAGEFDPALVQQFAEQSRQSGINVIALDIESWFGAIDGQILSGGAIAQDFSTMFKSFKRINPEAKIGNYDVPVANLNLIRFLRSGCGIRIVARPSSLDRPVMPSASRSGWRVGLGDRDRRRST
jgi:hypothetical protein